MLPPHNTAVRAEDYCENGIIETARAPRERIPVATQGGPSRWLRFDGEALDHGDVMFSTPQEHFRARNPRAMLPV